MVIMAVAMPTVAARIDNGYGGTAVVASTMQKSNL